MKLSVLIPAIPERQKNLFAILELLEGRADIEPIPLLTHRSDQGGPTIGEKRDWLVQRATGEYLTFWDDDDDRRFPKSIFDGMATGADVISFHARFRDCVVDMDFRFKGNEQYYHGAKYIKRRPWQMCIWKTEKARLVRFPFKNYGEDWSWCEGVLKYCGSHYKINEVLYNYNWDEKMSRATL